MLQKLSKCKVKVNRLYLPLILREINFGKIWISIIAIFTILETLNFEFW